MSIAVDHDFKVRIGMALHVEVEAIAYATFDPGYSAGWHEPGVQPELTIESIKPIAMFLYDADTNRPIGRFPVLTETKRACLLKAIECEMPDLENEICADLEAEIR